MSERVFLCRTRTKQGFICLAQGHSAVAPVIFEPAIPRSRDKHSTTALPTRLCKQKTTILIRAFFQQADANLQHVYKIHNTIQSIKKMIISKWFPTNILNLLPRHKLLLHAIIVGIFLKRKLNRDNMTMI